MYSIQDLERLSGIKAHTIRIWEKRYSLLTPGRTDTNIRYYNDDQLRKLLNTCTLISNGGKISKVSKLSESAISKEVEALMMPKSKDEQLDVFINKIIESGLTYNNQLFENSFASATLRLGLYKCYRHVILPALIKLGLMWGKKDLMPTQEHFITNLIKQKLFSAIDGLDAPETNSKRYLLFLPEHEDHEIGLLFAHYIIRKSGKTVIYLGQNVPTKDLETTIKQTNPDVLILFVVRTWHKDELIPMMDSITKKFKKGKTILCGNSALTDLVKQNRSLLKANSIEDLENIM
jgi:DNA-binding transcriptional MerR regulator/methylmalonyl-CoA mutase cobalamin-binding subunit|tara:strand:- start:2066 stop:2938 length:873 start_codon:yes stop_codon:yes gene_type:complete